MSDVLEYAIQTVEDALKPKAPLSHEEVLALIETVADQIGAYRSPLSDISVDDFLSAGEVYKLAEAIVWKVIIPKFCPELAEKEGTYEPL